MHTIKYLLGFLVLFSMLTHCKDSGPQFYEATHPYLVYKGRTLVKDSTVALIGSAASVEFWVKGKEVHIQVQAEQEPRSYVVLTLNHEPYQRIQLDGTALQTLTVSLPDNKAALVGLHKANEAFQGEINIHQIQAQAVLPFTETRQGVIEFIGDSITCGALADNTQMPCDQGTYADHHNAYLAYGPRVARALNANVILSSVSGIGMYRNWNDEHQDEAIMPDVYENLYLNTDSTQRYSFQPKPDVVSICLGTNDYSDGDGSKPRLPFNPEAYTANYINFVTTVYSHYPNTKIALLNSPMVHGARNDTLMACLNRVKDYFKTSKGKDIRIFEFDTLYVTGCSYHPSIAENQVMAEKLVPFFKTLWTK